MICPGCNREVGKYAGDYCPFCGAPLKPPQETPPDEYRIEQGRSFEQMPSEQAYQQPPPGGAAPRQAQEGPPWEDSERPFFERIFSTARESMLNPVQFFKNMRTYGGYSQPLFYAFIFGTVGALAGLSWNSLFQFAGPLATGEAKAVLPMGIMLIAWVFILPLFVIIGTFIGAAITHLFLMIFGGANGGYETTYRVLCYSYAPNLFQIIPCAGIVGAIWILVIEIIGLKEAHGTDYWRVALAVFAPTILIFFCCCASIMIFLPALMQAGR